MKGVFNMSQKYCQGPSVILMTLRTESEDLKIIRGMKQEEDHHSIILMVMRVQCNASEIGSMSMAHEPWTISVE